jgi:diguanylate cyclase (GGDEF)-like protein
MMAKHILCVDDVENNLFVLANLLGKEQGYQIYSAASGQKALEVLLKESIDLILLDIMMPEMDGFEVAALIKNSPMTQEIPIIFVTAKTDEESIIEAYAKGGVDYVVKPYRSYELLERIKLHLSLQETKKRLRAKQKMLESILDQQENLIITTDGTKVFQANQAFITFLQLDSTQNITQQIRDIKNKFHKCQYYDIDDLQHNTQWLHSIYKNETQRDFIVAMVNQRSMRKHAFMLKVTKIEDEANYIVTFNDVTHLVMESKELEKKAFHDSLTGLYNREKLSEFIEYEIKIVQRYHTPLSIILFDIDDFKAINDTYGHLQGDSVLKRLTQEVQAKIRSTDLFVRWGGEEFVIVAPSTARNSAVSLAQHIRKSIEVLDFETRDTITCSFGVTSYHPKDDLDSMIARVDEAMYEAKTGGKNQVVTR